jgi:cellulose synthase/poly-beta-1,6-N-acetylglucosamine synthase-like glycosyltransferase
MAGQDPRVELIRNPVGIIPVSLNLALARARGRWFVRVDAHAEIPPRYVRTAVDHLGSGLWGGVGGRKNAVGTTPAGRAVAAAMSSKFGVGNSTYHYGTRVQPVEHIPFGAYPTELIRRLGGWDEDLVVNQDFEFDFRLRQAGYRLLFDPNLTIDWQCQQSIPNLFRQYRRYGKGKARVARLHLRSLRLRHLAAPGLTASWVLAALLALKRPGPALISLLPYSGAVIAASAFAARPLDGRRERQWLPAAFVAMHAGWGIGFWEGVTQLAAEALRLKEPPRPRARPGRPTRSTPCPLKFRSPDR